MAKIRVLLTGGAATLGLIALAPGTAHAAPATTAFAFTGAAQTFVVPAGICSVEVDALGAAGRRLRRRDHRAGSVARPRRPSP